MSCRVVQFRAEVEASHRRPRSADHKPGWCTGVYVTLGASSLGNLRDPNPSLGGDSMWPRTRNITRSDPQWYRDDPWSTVVSHEDGHIGADQELGDAAPKHLPSPGKRCIGAYSASQRGPDIPAVVQVEAVVGAPPQYLHSLGSFL